MKKYIITVSILVVLLFAGYQAYYRLGIYLPLASTSQPLEYTVTTEGKTILKREQDGTFAPFEIRGVDLGSGCPGQWSVDYAIDKETYKRWFGYIQELGANTIRVYAIHHEDFYDALYEYNTRREQEGEAPLYLLHGLWINDYVFNSHNSAFSEELLGTFLDDSRTLVDVLHGNVSLNLGYQGVGSGSYRRDVSKWVLGYILGVEWESTLVSYTNQTDADRAGYAGTYLHTTEDATPFESMLAQAGDKIIEYETNRYRQQRLVAFANWPATDPFVYPLMVYYSRHKFSCVDVEHIQSDPEAFRSGMFASYHVYPYFPDYAQSILEGKRYTDEDYSTLFGPQVKAVLEYRNSLMEGPRFEDCLREEDCIDGQGRRNTYLGYLRVLNRYHTIPVIISEYGLTTGRGMAQEDVNTGRNQGYMTEQEQGRALVECYQDIMAAGCAGSCLFSWQDEWFKHTWNTVHAVDTNRNPYWSDCQTNEQSFGLLAFDPGKEKSVCYVDGDLSEWAEEDLVIQNGDMNLSMKYDEKFIYLLIHKEGFDPAGDTLYVPIDTNPKVGSTRAQDQDLAFERAADFLLVICGRQDSRLLVQERYEALMSTYHQEYYGINPYFKENTPSPSSPVFKPILMPLLLSKPMTQMMDQGLAISDPTAGVSYETGKLRYGNANPEAADFDSLADFIFSGDYVEIRLPWQLLNFSDPSEMMIHDDYYEHFGIENLPIDKIYLGVGSGTNTEHRIPMSAVPLEGWGRQVTSHERLKRSYYILRDYWASLT